MSRLRPALADLLMRVAIACITAAEWLDPIELPPSLGKRNADLLLAAALERERRTGEDGSMNGRAPDDR